MALFKHLKILLETRELNKIIERNDIMTIGKKDHTKSPSETNGPVVKTGPTSGKKQGKKINWRMEKKKV